MKAVTLNRQSSLRRWAYVMTVATLVVVASGRSAVAGPGISNFDKVVHFSVYGLLGTLVLRALGGGRASWAIVLVSLFGVSDEVHQSFTPGRAMEFADWVADTLGATVAVTAYVRWKGYREWLEKPLFTHRTVNEKKQTAAPLANAA